MDGKDEQYGILLIDSVNPKYGNKVRAKIGTLFESGTEYKKNEHLIEDPIFVDSNYRHLSQLVDRVAYCIRRRFREAEVDESDRRAFTEFFDTIKPKLLKNESITDGYGLKIFP